MTVLVPDDPLPSGRSALCLSRIAAAVTVIDPVFLETPQYVSAELSDATGTRVLVKVETLNPVGSFKGRGASLLLASLSDDPRPIVCASAGNFGQGIAYAARREGRTVHVFAAESASPSKIAQMERLGAFVHLHGADLDAAKLRAREHAEAEGYLFVEDGRDAPIAEGAATVAVELARARPDTIVVPVGNGALAAGVGRWTAAALPGTAVIGVTTAGAPSMRLSWQRNEPVETATVTTIADGMAVRVPVPEALRELRHAVSDIVEVNDGDLRRAGRLLLRGLRIVAEPAGVAALAALLRHGDIFAGRLVAVVVTGSNVDPNGDPWFAS
jgi:threonine dehydratase